MHNKQDLKRRQRTTTTSIAPSSSEALEQRVLSHAVIQEVIRLFDARIVTIVRDGANERDGLLAVEQQVLCFSSQEVREGRSMV